jgi:hypothetical protein
MDNSVFFRHAQPSDRRGTRGLGAGFAYTAVMIYMLDPFKSQLKRLVE